MSSSFFPNRSWYVVGMAHLDRRFPELGLSDRDLA
jgi:hypothetical protein